MKREAFTLIEVIIVLVIFGIVASIGSEILFQAYQNYLLAKSTDTVYYKTIYALDTIEAKLRAKIANYCIGRKGTSGSDFDNIKTLHSINPGEGYKVMECALYAQEARRGQYDTTSHYAIPGWSGFIDLDDPKTDKTQQTVATPGSKLSFARDIIKALSHNSCDLDAASSHIVMVFPGVYPSIDPRDALGWRLYKDPSKKSDLRAFQVKRVDDTTMQFTDVVPNEIKDIYYLAYTAVAYVPEQQPDGSYNLYLYYNYRPWDGETYKQGEKALVIDKISSFHFRQIAKNIALKICSYTRFGDENITFCAERSIP